MNNIDILLQINNVKSTTDAILPQMHRGATGPTSLLHQLHQVFPSGRGMVEEDGLDGWRTKTCFLLLNLPMVICCTLFKYMKSYCFYVCSNS